MLGARDTRGQPRARDAANGVEVVEGIGRQVRGAEGWHGTNQPAGDARPCLRAWALAHHPDNHLVSMFQAAPQTGQVRNKMMYKKDHDRPGDTHYNAWPVPM